MGYKWCLVPQCTNTTLKTPEKLFVSVPTNLKIRKKWLQLARRDPNEVPTSSCFFCEDHFDMDKDITNYTQFKMGFSQRLLLADGVLPSKFHCQEDRRKRQCNPSTSRSAYMKRQKIELVQEFHEKTKSTLKNVTSSSCKDEIQENIMSEPIEIPKTQDKDIATDPILTAEKSVQIGLKAHYRSKATQTRTLSKDIALSPHKISTSSKTTSPFKKFSSHFQPSTADAINVKKKIPFLEELSDNDPSTSPSKDSDTGASEVNAEIGKMESLKNTLHLIAKKPLMYVGLSKETYFLIQLMHKHCNIPVEHILMCFKKIRLNSTFSELEDNFGISLSYGSKIFSKSIPLIASVLRPFIVDLDPSLIKKRLPISFRHNLYNVSCIIDCLEIDIQKPSKALHQALTWSNYKKSNTVKYLISCTPNGLVNYISPGFGGRASDVTVLENCNFLDGLPPGTFILADRGFKHLEQILANRGIKLVRPPSVTAGAKLSKTEVRKTKIIASLRIHIERVIRRFREFHMLKQHSVINNNMLCVLNDVVVIACALINLQDSLIK